MAGVHRVCRCRASTLERNRVAFWLTIHRHEPTIREESRPDRGLIKTPVISLSPRRSTPYHAGMGSGHVGIADITTAADDETQNGAEFSPIAPHVG